MKLLLGIVLLAALIAFCVHWEFAECRKVGHGVLYCLAHIGRGIE